MKKTFFFLSILTLTCSSVFAQTDKEEALKVLAQKFKESSYRIGSLDSDLPNYRDCVEQLADDGRFDDMRALQIELEKGALTSTSAANQEKSAAFIYKAYMRLWKIAEVYRNKELSNTKFSDIRDKYWKTVENYSAMERKRPNTGNRFHTSCFALPTAAVNIYFCFYDEMINIENGVEGLTAYKKANELLQEIAYQSWTQPYRNDATDANPVQVARFRKDVWWVGGNALSYRSLLPVSVMKKSVPMMDVLTEVAQGGLSRVSQNTLDDAFWTEGYTADGAGWGHGMQNLIWGYPAEGSASAMEILVALKDTPWAETLNQENKESILNFLRGGSWYYYGGYTPPCLDRGSMKYFQDRKGPIQSRGLANNVNTHFINSYSSPEKEEVIDFTKEAMSGSNSTILMPGQEPGKYQGTRWFYNNDDFIKKQSDYYVLINMASVRCDGLESANNFADEYNFFTCDGLTFLQKRGDEYRKAIGAWNLTSLPGITSRQTLQKDIRPVTNWSGYCSIHNYAAAATRGGANGVSGFIFEKMNATFKYRDDIVEPNPRIFGVQAYKGYFFFGDYLLCLGAGVTNKKTIYTEDIQTCIDQTTRSGDVKIITAANTETFTTDQTINKTIDFTTTPTWIAQDGGFMYTLLMPYSSKLEVRGETRSTQWNVLNIENKKVSTPTTANILHLWVNHGKTPTNDSYGYVVYCGNTNSETIAATELPFEVIVNTPKLQAAQSKDHRIIQALFYSANETLQIRDKFIKVSAPCALMIEEENGRCHVSVGDAEMNKSLTKITITTNLPFKGAGVETVDGNKQFSIDLPQGKDCGKPATASFETSGPLSIKNVYSEGKDVLRHAGHIQFTGQQPELIELYDFSGKLLVKGVNTNLFVLNTNQFYIVKYCVNGVWKVAKI